MVNPTTTNCNFWLTRLYSKRDYIGSCIDFVRMKEEGSSEFLEKKYDEIVDEIDKFLAFRRTHDCLIKGDKGYGPE